MFPLVDYPSSLLNPAQAAALQRIQDAVVRAYDDDKRITLSETEAIVADLATNGITDAELSAARFLLHHSTSYLPQLRTQFSRAQADEVRLREVAHRSVADEEAWRQAKTAADDLGAQLDKADAVNLAYGNIVEQLEHRAASRN